MRYKVVKKTGFELGEPFAEFIHLEDARLFVRRKIEEEAKQKIYCIYYICDEEDIIDELKASPPPPEPPKIEKKTHTVFSPTPLNMKPKPSSVLPDYLIEKEDNEDGIK